MYNVKLHSLWNSTIQSYDRFCFLIIVIYIHILDNIYPYPCLQVSRRYFVSLKDLNIWLAMGYGLLADMTEMTLKNNAAVESTLLCFCYCHVKNMWQVFY